MVTRFKTLLILFCTLIIIVLLRKDSALPQSDYDRLMLYKKLIRTENKVISVRTSKPAYSIVKNREDVLGPFYITYEAEHLTHDRRNRVEDTDKRVVVCGRIGKTQKGFLLWGPYKRFPAGLFEVKITMKAENIKDKSAPVAVFDAVSSKGTIVHAKKEIYEKDFQVSDDYAEIVTLLEIKSEVSDIELRIHYLDNADIYIDRIDITILNSKPKSKGIDVNMQSIMFSVIPAPPRESGDPQG